MSEALSSTLTDSTSQANVRQGLKVCQSKDVHHTSKKIY
jgi:hypothetical protein